MYFVINYKIIRKDKKQNWNKIHYKKSESVYPKFKIKWKNIHILIEKGKHRQTNNETFSPC